MRRLTADVRTAPCGSLLARRGTNPAQRARLLFEGARLLTGDGRPPIENSAFVVEGAHHSGRARGAFNAQARGATVVDLRGKTVMPAIIDAHSHLGYTDVRTGNTSSAHYTRDNLLDHLRRYAYYGIAATLSMGLDRGELPYELRAMPVDGTALFRTAGRGIAMPNAGPNASTGEDAAYGVTTESEGAAGCPRACCEESRLRQDLGGRQEQDGHAAAAVALSSDHRGSPHARAARDRARLLPCRREGAAARRYRRFRARHPRPRSGRRDHGALQGTSAGLRDPEPAGHAAIGRRSPVAERDAATVTDRGVEADRGDERSRGRGCSTCRHAA